MCEKIQKMMVVALVLISTLSQAADGVWTAGSGVWTNTAAWVDGVLPDAGGTASFVGSSGSSTVTVPDGSPFSLSAMLVNTNNADKSWTVKGETNTLVSPAIVRVDTYNFFLTSALAGSDGLQKTGDGTLILPTPNPLLSGSVQVLGGRVLVESDEDLGQVPASYQADAIVLDTAGFGNNDPTLTLAETRGVTLGTGGGFLFGRGDNDTVMASPITGAGPLYVNMQSGNVVLSNTNNAYTSNTVVGASGPGYFGSATSATLRLGADEVIPDGAGAGGLVIDGTQKGLLDLNGRTETVNWLTGLGSAVIANSAASEGVLRANADDSDTTFSGSLQAGVTIEKIGAGTLTYSNTAASAGSIRVTAGALQADSADDLGTVSVTLAGGILKTPVQGATPQRFIAPLYLATDGTLDRSLATAPIIWGADVAQTLDASGLPVLTVSGGSEAFAIGATDSPALFNADVADSNGVLFRDRTWLATLPTSSSWSIASGADVTIGTPGLLGTGDMVLSTYSVRLPAPDTLGTGGETVTVGGGTNSVWFDTTRLAGMTVTNDPGYAFTASNNVVLSGVAANVGFDGAGTVTYAGTISGSGTLVKNGSGDAVLTTANSFGGGVQVNEGRLLVSEGGQLGDSTNFLTLAGGYLAKASGASLTLSNTVQVTSGGLDVPDATLELTGEVNGTVVKQGSGTLTLGGTSDNAALDLYVADGVAVLAKSSAQAVRDITGVDTDAIVRLDGTGGDLIGGGVSLSGGTLDLAGHNEGIGFLASTAPSIVTNSVAVPVTLTLNGTVDANYIGAMAGEISIVKNGAESQALAAYPDQSAAVSATVNQGDLDLGSGPRYVRFTVTKTRYNARPIISEIMLTRNGRPIPYSTSSSTQTYASTSPYFSALLIDNDSRTCWYSAINTPAWFTLVLGEPTVFDGYRWYTGPKEVSTSSNDPVSWIVEISIDNIHWVTVDTREDEPLYSDNRSIKAGDFSIDPANWPSAALDPAAAVAISDGATVIDRLADVTIGSLSGAGILQFLRGAGLTVDDASTFTGSLDGPGTLSVSADTPLDIPAGSADNTTVKQYAGEVLHLATALTVVRNLSASPASVLIGANDESEFAGFLTDGPSAAVGLAKHGTGVTRLFDVGSDYTGDTVVESGTLALQPSVWSFRYLRYNVTDTLNNGVAISAFALAYAEFQLLLNGEVVTWPVGTTATAPATGAHGDDNPMKAIDGNINNRWLTKPLQALTIDTQAGVTFDAYRVYESGVNTADYLRCPKTWTVEGSDDGVTWVAVDSRTNVPTPPFVLGQGQLIGTFQVRSSLRSNLPNEFRAETPITNLYLTAVTAQRFCFSVLANRNELNETEYGETGFQLAELQLLRNGEVVPWPAGTTAWAPGGSYPGYPVERIVDNDIAEVMANRFYSDSAVNPIFINANTNLIFDAYRWVTAYNTPNRDPVSWSLAVSDAAGTDYYGIDEQTDVSFSTDRGAIIGPFELLLPAGLQATDAIPDLSRMRIDSGALLSMENGALETVGPLSGTGTVALVDGAVFGINGFEDASFAGGIIGTGRVTKTGTAVQTLSGTLAFSGDIIVEAGTLDLEGATLTGVTNIVIRSGGTLAGAATVSGDLTVTFEGGLYRADLTVSGALSVTGDMQLALPAGVELPYTQQLFSFGSADTATRAVIQASQSSLTVPTGYASAVHLTPATAYLTVSTPGTLLMIK